MNLKNRKEKFEFGVDFQQLILQVTVTDNLRGPKIIKYYEDTYFTLIKHAVICELLKKYYKKKKKIASETILRENLRVFYQTNKLARSLTPDDKRDITNTISEIYQSIPPESDEIMDKCIQFARYVNFKNELENVDLSKYDSYTASANKILKALNIGREAAESMGTFIVSGMKDRAFNRDSEQSWPTPFWQLNRLFNSKGVGKGNVIMLMSEQKRFKTGSLINVAIGYLRMRKKVLYLDYENGEIALTTRVEQSIANVDQEAILKSKEDKRLMKMFRRYARLKSELVIKRMSAYNSDMNDVKAYMAEIKQTLGINFDVVIMDYGDLSGATTKVIDDTKRISDVYVDMKNLAFEEDLECIWTASHVKRDAYKRIGTKFQPGDVAKCIDKMSHLDLAIGIQESDEEKAAGVMRWEIILQRNGARDGQMFFWLNIEKQRLREFTKEQLDKYYKQIHQSNDDEKPIRKPKHGDI